MSKAIYPSLNEKPVLISGGASGIGAAIVRGFGAQGARVGFVDLLEEAGASLAEELQGLGQKVAFQCCDITDTTQYWRAIAQFEKMHGPCLVLVNNAANDTRMDWREVTPDEFNRRISVNLAHAFFAIQAVAPGMTAAGQGSIVNFGSISWMAAQAGVPVYTAAKAVTHGTTRRRSHLPPLLRTSLLETEGGPMAERITQACAKPLILVQLQVGPPFPEGRRRRSLRAAAGQSAGDRH